MLFLKTWTVNMIVLKKPFCCVAFCQFNWMTNIFILINRFVIHLDYKHADPNKPFIVHILNSFIWITISFYPEKKK